MTTTKSHGSLLTTDGIHGVAAWSFDNAAAREALSVIENDIAKIARQKDDGSLWTLALASPKTWRRIDTDHFLFVDQSISDLMAKGQNDGVTVGRKALSPGGEIYVCASATSTTSIWRPASRIFNVQDFGGDPTGNTSSKVAIDNALACMENSSGVLLFPPGTWYDPVGGARTFGQFVEVAWAPNAIYYNGAGTTSTFYNLPRAGSGQQIFLALEDVGGSGGKIRFATQQRVTGALYPEWWGAKGNAGADCSPAIRAAHFASASGQWIVLGNGTYDIETSITSSGIDRPFQLLGQGHRSGTALRWAGASGGRMFDLSAVTSRVVISGVNIGSSASMANAIRIDGMQHTVIKDVSIAPGASITDAAIRTINNQYDLILTSIIILASDAGTIQNGIVIDRGDPMYMSGIYIQNCEANGVVVGDGSQSALIAMDKVHIDVSTGTVAGYPGENNANGFWLRSVQGLSMVGCSVRLANDASSPPNGIALTALKIGQVGGGCIAGCYIDCAGRAETPILITSNNAKDVVVTGLTVWNHSNASGTKYVANLDAGVTSPVVRFLGPTYVGSTGAGDVDGGGEQYLCPRLLAASATPSVGFGDGSFETSASSPAITSLSDMRVGDTVVVIAKHAVQFTHSSGFALSGSVNFTTASGNRHTFHKGRDGNIREIARVVA